MLRTTLMDACILNTDLLNYIFDGMGRISYEFYLVHFVVILAMRPYSNYLNGISYFAAGLAGSVLLAFLMERILSHKIKKFKLIINKWQQRWCLGMEK